MFKGKITPSIASLKKHDRATLIMLAADDNLSPAAKNYIRIILIDRQKRGDSF